MSDDSDDVKNEIVREAIKDLYVDKPFTRTERLDNVSSSILETVGVILTILVAVFSISIGKGASAAARVTLLTGCFAFVLAMICLIASIRSREITVPAKLTLKSYFKLLETIDKLNDKKKSLQNMGLGFLIVGALITLIFLILWTLGI